MSQGTPNNFHCRLDSFVPYEITVHGKGQQGSTRRAPAHKVDSVGDDKGTTQDVLVGGFNHLEKYESQWKGLSHFLWKKKLMFQTTNQCHMETYGNLDPLNAQLGRENSRVCRQGHLHLRFSSYTCLDVDWRH